MISPQDMEKVPFLRDLGGPYADQLAGLARLKEYAPGAVIFRQGEDYPYLCLVLEGEVSLDVAVSGEAVAEVHRGGPGELLGWSPVLGRRSMTATGRAATALRLAVLEMEELLGLCERDGYFGSAFYRQVALVLSSRLDETRRRLSRYLAHRPVMGAPSEGSD
jgi:CRP-like cAMP-binding protein